MDKRYQVFVSSTYEDLQEERKEVMQALLELDCIPAGMELFPASNDDQWTLIKSVIDDCDYYLLIVGGKYGSTNEDGISYTQMEFEYALETKKPIISFLPKDPDSIPSGKTEKDPQKAEMLEKFKSVAQKKMVQFWTNPDDLGSKVSRSMIKLIKQHPAIGWVRANEITDEKAVQEITRLQNENNILKQKIEKIATSPPEGTERLAQGTDIEYVDVNFDYVYKDSYMGLEMEKINCYLSIKYTWDSLFRVIAPSLIYECGESELRHILSESVREGFSLEVELVNKGYKPTENWYTSSVIKVTDASFGQILVQFKALGLITLSDKKRSARSSDTYWCLTPYGDYVMTSLMAIKRQNHSDV